MKNKNAKLQIYQGIIQYLLDTTNYTLKNIADLSSCSIKSIRCIYCEGFLPDNFPSEIQLLRLFQMILEIHTQEQVFARYLPLPKGFRQLNASME